MSSGYAGLLREPLITQPSSPSPDETRQDAWAECRNLQRECINNGLPGVQVYGNQGDAYGYNMPIKVLPGETVIE
jgi:hypothetical protein